MPRPCGLIQRFLKLYPEKASQAQQDAHHSSWLDPFCQQAWGTHWHRAIWRNCSRSSRRKVKSQFNHPIRLPCRQGIHGSQAEITGAVAAIEGGFLLLHDGESGIDMAYIIAAGDAVEMKERAANLARRWRRRASSQGKGGRTFPAASTWPMSQAKGAISWVV